MPLSFHWRLPRAVGRRAGSPPDLEAQVAFCREADRSGIGSVMVDIGPDRPDPMALALALARETDRVRFLVAASPGLMSPTLFVQQVNTFSALASGRIALNIDAGNTPDDPPDCDARLARMDEFLTICRALWDRRGPVNYAGRFYRIEDGRLNTPFVAPDRTRPEVYVAGDSPQARDLAARHGDVWLPPAGTPERIRAEVAPLREAGIEVALRLSVTCRPTREEDGATAACLIGTPGEVADGLLAFGAAGVSRFLLSGRDDLEEMLRFGREVLPIVRAAGR